MRNETKAQCLDLCNDRLLTEEQLAERHQRSIKTLQNLRITGGGIPFVKFGRSVRYRLSDIVRWEHAHVRSSTSDQGDGQ